VIDAQAWHRCLAHASQRYVERSIGRSITLDPCDACELSKSQRQLHHEELDRPLECFTHLVTGICGPVRSEGIGQVNYLIFVTDRASGYRWSLTLRTKDQGVQKLRQLLQEIATQYGVRTKTLTTDGSRELHAELPGLVRARSMMLAAQLPGKLWPEVAAAATHIGNLTYTRVHGMSPIQKALSLSGEGAGNGSRGMEGLPATLDHLRVVGCQAFVNIPEARRNASAKFEASAERGVLVGFACTANYRIFIPERQAVVVTPHVTFHEADFPYVQRREPEPEVEWHPEDQEEPVDDDLDVYPDEDAVPPPQEPVGESPLADTWTQWKPTWEASSTGSEIEVQAPPRRRRRRRAKHWVQTVVYMAAADLQDLWTYRDVMQMPLEQQGPFLRAAQDEVDSLGRNGTWQLVPRNGGTRVLTGKWVFTQKRDQSGQVGTGDGSPPRMAATTTGCGNSFSPPGDRPGGLHGAAYGI
jgi:hypothetical protein